MQKTLQQNLDKASQLLTKISDTPRLDAQILLCYCLNVDRKFIFLHFDKLLSDKQQEDYFELIQIRLTGRHIAYIVGYREFWSLEFLVNESVLIPRPETETILEVILSTTQKHGLRVLDLGTGSGAIAVSLASERNDWSIIASDNSYEALNVAKNNLESFRIFKKN